MRLTNEELIQIIKEELEAVIDEKKGKKRKAAKKKPWPQRVAKRVPKRSPNSLKIATFGVLVLKV